MKGRPQSRAGLPPSPPGKGRVRGAPEGGRSGAASPHGTELARASRMQRAGGWRGAPALAVGSVGLRRRFPGRAERALPREEGSVPAAAPRPGAGRPGGAGGVCGGSRARGGTGVSQPAAAGGREKLGQPQRRKDKMAAAQAEVRSEARAQRRGRWRCVRSGRARPAEGATPASWNRVKQRPGAGLGAAILEPGTGTAREAGRAPKPGLLQARPREERPALRNRLGRGSCGKRSERLPRERCC